MQSKNRTHLFHFLLVLSSLNNAAVCFTVDMMGLEKQNDEVISAML